MLPDFPGVKERLAMHLDNYLRRRYREYLGHFAEIPAFRHHEGDTWGLQREDGSVEESEYRHMEEGFSVAFEEAPRLSLDNVMEKLDQVAAAMAKDLARHVLSDISDALDKSDRAINAEGKSFSKELFLEALDSMWLSFDRLGELQPPAIVMHPDMWETVRVEVEKWEEDPQFRKEYRNLLVRKREEWRVRENRRKLVD